MELRSSRALSCQRPAIISAVSGADGVVYLHSNSGDLVGESEERTPLSTAFIVHGHHGYRHPPKAASALQSKSRDLDLGLGLQIRNVLLGIADILGCFFAPFPLFSKA